MNESGSLPRAEPRYFGNPDRPLFGWLHRPSPSVAARGVGVVICNPLGYEALCSHRSLRLFAERAAGLGSPALRFDYDGTGDSAGDELDPARWRAWRQSVLDAVLEMKAATGVSRVCLFGVRIGGMIAALAAAESAEVDALVLLAPAVSGKHWLREMRAVHAAMGRPEAPPQFALPAGTHEVVGLLFDHATRDEIAATDLWDVSERLRGDVLLIDRTDRPPNARLADRLRETGSRVEHAVLPGYVEMMLDAHFAEPPASMLDAFAQWLAGLEVGASREGPSVPRNPTASALVAPGLEETTEFLDPDRRLFGIVSAPIGARPTRAIVLLNAGANSHIGTGRLHVKIARRLAASGWLVLRFDMSGIGDSLPHPGAAENVVYTPHALEDLSAAVAFLRNRYDPSHTEALGLCSGAYYAFKAAVAGQRLDGVTVVNPLVFYWKESTSLAYPPYEMVRAANQYQKSMLQASKWRQLFRGEVNLRLVASVVTHRLAERFRLALREVARALHIPLSEDLASELAMVAKRRIALRFVFSEGDPGTALLQVGAGSRLGWLARRGALRIDRLPSCDHNLSLAWMHEAFWAVLIRNLPSP